MSINKTLSKYKYIIEQNTLYKGSIKVLLRYLRRKQIDTLVIECSGINWLDSIWNIKLGLKTKRNLTLVEKACQTLFLKQEKFRNREIPC